MSGYKEDWTAAVNTAWFGEILTEDGSTEYGDTQEDFASLARAERARPRLQKPDCEHVLKSCALKADDSFTRRSPRTPRKDQERMTDAFLSRSPFLSRKRGGKKIKQRLVRCPAQIPSVHVNHRCPHSSRAQQPLKISKPFPQPCRIIGCEIIVRPPIKRFVEKPSGESHCWRFSM